jgi:hypothetical protein
VLVEVYVVIKTEKIGAKNAKVLNIASMILYEHIVWNAKVDQYALIMLEELDVVNVIFQDI